MELELIIIINKIRNSMIYKEIQIIKQQAIRLQGINMCSFGAIQEIDDKKSIFYPLVNVDVVKGQTINNSVQKHTVRIYVMDRNAPYIAYNKCELLLNELMLLLEIPTFTINYFNYNYSDFEFKNSNKVNGVYCDVEIESEIKLKCIYDELADKSFVITEESDYIKEYLLQENSGRVFVEDETNTEV